MSATRSRSPSVSLLLRTPSLQGYAKLSSDAHLAFVVSHVDAQRGLSHLLTNRKCIFSAGMGELHVQADQLKLARLVPLTRYPQRLVGHISKQNITFPIVGFHSHSRTVSLLATSCPPVLYESHMMDNQEPGIPAARFATNGSPISTKDSVYGYRIAR